MDTVIAMVISGIVIGMASTFFSGLTQTITGFQSSSEEAATYQQFLFLMKRDFDKATTVTATENGIRTENKTENTFVEYFFEKKYILRNQGNILTDTLPLQPLETELFFGPLPAAYGSLVDRMNITVKSEHTQMYFCWKKEYANAFLINRENYGR
ncbi:MAG: hypothetical protein ACOZCO_00910 [Bacteroidota bacterium]